MNQSHAIFIFVTDEIFFNSLTENPDERSIYYTIFSQKIFLQRPKFSEISTFMEDIVADDPQQKTPLNQKEQSYQLFYIYACYASKSDFFDLYSI